MIDFKAEQKPTVCFWLDRFHFGPTLTSIHPSCGTTLWKYLTDDSLPSARLRSPRIPEKTETRKWRTLGANYGGSIAVIKGLLTSGATRGRTQSETERDQSRRDVGLTQTGSLTCDFHAGFCADRVEARSLRAHFALVPSATVQAHVLQQHLLVIGFSVL